jgi:hypothetical protein
MSDIRTISAGRSDVFHVDSTSHIEMTKSRLPASALAIYAEFTEAAELAEAQAIRKENKVARLKEKRQAQADEVAHFDRQLRSLRTITPEMQRHRAKLAAKAQKTSAEIQAVYDEKPVREYRESQLNGWAAKHRGTATYAAVEPKLPMGDLEEALRRNLEGREFFLQQVRQVELADLPLDEAKAAAAAQIDRIARQGVPNVKPLLRMPKDERGRRAQGHIKFKNAAQRGTIELAPDTWSTFVWLNRDALVAKVSAMLEEVASGDSIPAAERPVRLADLNQQIRALEYEESAICRAARKRGLALPYRDTMNPEAVLLIEVVSGAR